MDSMLDHSHLFAGSSIVQGASVEQKNQSKHGLRGQASTIPPKKRKHFLDAYKDRVGEERETKRCTKPRSSNGSARRRPRTDCQILVIFSAPPLPETLAIVPVTRDLAVVNVGNLVQQEVEEEEEEEEDDHQTNIVAVGNAGELVADAVTNRAIANIGTGGEEDVDDEDDDLYSRVKKRKRRTVRELELSRMSNNESSSSTRLRRIDYSLSESHLRSREVKLLEPPTSTYGSSSSTRRGRRTSVIETPAESTSTSRRGRWRGRGRGRRKLKYLSIENILERALHVSVPPATTESAVSTTLSFLPLAVVDHRLAHPLPLSVLPPGGTPQPW